MQLDMLIELCQVKGFLANYTFDELNRLIHHLMLLFEGIVLGSVCAADHFDILTGTLLRFMVVLNSNLLIWPVFIILISDNLKTVVG
jgi:hypothetical protein